MQRQRQKRNRWDFGVYVGFLLFIVSGVDVIMGLNWAAVLFIGLGFACMANSWFWSKEERRLSV